MEQIKHFFSVKGIVFVLSIDKTQLGNAIRGVYGSEKIDADEYLRRFIDIEYTIQAPDTTKFCNYLYEYFEFDTFFESEFRGNTNELKGDKNLFVTVAAKTFEHANVTLRQQEKTFAHSRIVLNSFTENAYVFPSLLFILVFIRSFHKELYTSIKYKRLTLDQLVEDFSKILPANLKDSELNYFMHLEANLVYMYNNSINHFSRKELIEKDNDGNEISIIKSKIDSVNNMSFTRFLQGFLNHWHLNNPSIDYLTNRIDFTEHVVL